MWLVKEYVTWYLKQRSEYFCKMQIIIFNWLIYLRSLVSIKG